MFFRSFRPGGPWRMGWRRTPPEGLQWQPMVDGTSPAPTGIPSVVCGPRKFYSVRNSSMVIQHNCKNRWAVSAPWGQPLLTVDGSAPAGLPHSALPVCSGWHGSAVALLCSTLWLCSTSSDGRNTAQWAVQCKGTRVDMAVRLSSFCFVFLSPVSHQELFLVGIFFLKVHSS